jgi:hypothetical protein
MKLIRQPEGLYQLLLSDAEVRGLFQGVEVRLREHTPMNLAEHKLWEVGYGVFIRGSESAEIDRLPLVSSPDDGRR